MTFRGRKAGGEASRQSPTFRARAHPKRYNRTVRLVVSLAAFLAACGGSSSKKGIVPMQGSAAAGAPMTAPPAIAPAPAGKPGGASATPAPVVLRTIGCPVPTCVLHPNHGTYFTCLNGGAGTCFHFGGPCVPDGACMYDQQ